MSKLPRLCQTPAHYRIYKCKCFHSAMPNFDIVLINKQNWCKSKYDIWVLQHKIPPWKISSVKRCRSQGPLPNLGCFMVTYYASASSRRQSGKRVLQFTSFPPSVTVSRNLPKESLLSWNRADSRFKKIILSWKRAVWIPIRNCLYQKFIYVSKTIERLTPSYSI